MSDLHEVKTISLRDFEKIPIMYDEEGSFERMHLSVGDYYIMRELDEFPDRGSVVSVYEVIKLTERGHESRVRVLRIE